MAVANHEIAVGQHFEGRHPSQTNTFEFVLRQLPNDLTGSRYFDDTVAVASGNQGVAIGQPQRAEALVAEGLEAVASLALAAKHGHVVFPDYAPGVLFVFADKTIPLMTHQITVVRDLANESGVRVRVRTVDLHLGLAQEGAGAIDFDDSGWAAFGNHHAAVGQGLERVHFDAFAFVAVLGARIVLPHDLLGFAIDLDHLGRALLQHDVARWQNVQVVDATPRHLPFEFALTVENAELAIALRQHAVTLGGSAGGEGEGEDGEQ